MIAIILGGSILTSLIFATGLYYFVTAASNRRSVLGHIASDDADSSEKMIVLWDRRFRLTRPGRWVERQLVLSGIDDRKPIVVAAVAVVGGTAVGYFLSVALAPVFGLLGIAVAIVGVRVYLGRAKQRRMEQFIAQMPELARTLSNATNAGLSIAAAIAVAGHELAAPAGPELERVASRIQFGDTIQTAIEEMEVRMPSREVAVLVATLLVSTRSGGSLVTALRDIADTLEQRKETRREVRTTLTQSTTTGYLVIGIGFGMLFLLNMIQPGTVEAMTTSIAGQIALAAGSALFVFGFFIIRRITRFDG